MEALLPRLRAEGERRPGRGVDGAEAVPEASVAEGFEARDAGRAMRRGMLGRCPNCGQGRLFAGYLRLCPACEVCEAPVGRYRAADGPAFVTITVVGLLLIPILWWSFVAFRPNPRLALPGNSRVVAWRRAWGPGEDGMAIATYRGSCQCGAVRLEAELDLDQAITCNCSRCRRLGVVLAFAPAGRFRLEAGEDATTEYLFNKHAISHRFCRTCGIEAYAMGTRPDGTPMAAVNVNCLDGVDPRALATAHFDGANA